ncbi:MAG: extracellular solute-binding protein [Lachnospiraceae bacterium]|nr:extracellular solute-binding protein [Lachnospiraceae bacterium]
MKRKWVLFGVAAVMAASVLSGCGKKNEETNEAVALEKPDDIWAKYDEEVTLTTVVEENTGTVFYDGEDWDDNAWYDAYKDKFNINVENLWVSNDYGTKLNLAIADGDLPDVFHVDATQLQQLVEADMIMDLTQLLDYYGSDTLKGYYEYDPDTYQTGVFDGKLYGLPQESYGIIDQFQYVWIRKDWKDELGLADPQSMEDVINIAKAFKENYGAYGFGENQSIDGFKKFALAYGANPDIWIDTDDGIQYGNVQPEMKEALAAYAELYKEGLINPNMTTDDWEAVSQELINGKCGIIFWAQWLGYNPVPYVVDNLGKEAIFEPYEIPTISGDPVKASVSFGNRGYIVINKNCEHPEAAMKLINFFCYMMDDAIGNEDIDFILKLFDNSYTNIPFGLNVINPQTDYNQFVEVKEAVDKYLAGEEDIDVSAYGKNGSKISACMRWVENADSTGVGDWLQQGNERSAYGIAKEYVDNEQYVKNKIWGANPESLNTMGSTLNDILTEGFTKIITGVEDIDYFDTIVANWKAAGGDTVTADVNTMYGAEQ